MNKAPPLMAVELRDLVLVLDMRGRAPSMPTVAERITVMRDVAMFYVAFTYDGGGGIHFLLHIREDIAQFLPSGGRKI